MKAPKAPDLPPLPPAPAPPAPPPQLSSTLTSATNQRAAAARAAGKGFGDTILTSPEPLISLDKQAPSNVVGGGTDQQGRNRLLGAGL